MGFFYFCVLRRSKVAAEEASSIELKSDYNGNIFLSFIAKPALEGGWKEGKGWEFGLFFGTQNDVKYFLSCKLVK